MGITQKKTRTKTRRHLRDLDQISEDLRSPEHLQLHKNAKAPEDLPGLGQFYCVECAKWFESEYNLLGHQKGSTHRRRVKALKDRPYSQEEAEAAIGLGVDKFSRQAAKQNLNDTEVEMEKPDTMEEDLAT